jgi:hypothetical protein
MHEDPKNELFHRTCLPDLRTGSGEYCFWVLAIVLTPLCLAGGAGPALKLGGFVTDISLGLSFGMGIVILAVVDPFLSLPTGRTALFAIVLWQGWPLVLAYALWALVFFCLPVFIANFALSAWDRAKQARPTSLSDGDLAVQATAKRCEAPGMIYAIAGTCSAFFGAVLGFAWSANRSADWQHLWPGMFLYLFAALLAPALGPIALIRLRRRVLNWIVKQLSRR